MFKWKKKNGKYVINRSWVMTEAWAIVNRFKSMGATKPLGEAMKLAYFDKIVKDTRELIKQGYTMPNLSGLMMQKQ